MGCCASSPHTRRKYRDPADLDEEFVPIRYFGKYRSGSGVLPPDDIDGLPSTHINEHLASDPEILLYEAEIDQGTACRGLRPACCCLFTPWGLAFLVAGSLATIFKYCTCDAACCWLRKEYSTRTWYHVYPNRIQVNNPKLRVPFGFLGCGSWNADAILTHRFDRGAFGFRRVPCCVINFLCCLWPVYGGVVARQRCQCYGHRMHDCGGWWCDEWPCNMLCCTYRYFGIANPDEAAFASSIALQAYFEGRAITREDMDKCLEHWRSNISELHDPVERKRDVCCPENCQLPIPACTLCYEYVCNPKRKIPFDEENITDEVKEVYSNHENLRKNQIRVYREFTAPQRTSSVCRAAGCRRVFGRGGLIFCTEGCCEKFKIDLKVDDPAPPFLDRNIDDDNDASRVLQAVLGNPPSNVVYRRWEFDETQGEYKIASFPEELERTQTSKEDKSSTL